MKSRFIAVAIIAIGFFGYANLSLAQVSGVPGDGIPDIYYFEVNSTVMTSEGPIDRPAGTLTVDTDGSDMVTIIVGGPDATPGCDLCNNGFLPAPGSFFPNNWTLGFIAGKSQWIRTAPLAGFGFQGIIGEYDDPGGLFPEFGLANYGQGVIFENNLIDAAGEAWQVLYATDADGVFYTNVTTVPEPASTGLLSSALLGLGVASRYKVSDKVVRVGWVKRKC